jgi:hypothetical protein
MVTAVQRGPEADALLAALGAAVLTGDGERPEGGGFPGSDTTADFVPYVVLHQGIVTSIDGPVSDPSADAISEYQITGIGRTAPQARWAADKAHTAILGAVLTIPNRCVQKVEWTGGHPATRDDNVVPPLFYAIDLYQVSTSPA